MTSITHVHVQFAISWSRRLVLRNDFDKLIEYLEKTNMKFQNVSIVPYPDKVWNGIQSAFFMMELGATLRLSSIVIESNTNVVKLINSYIELQIWKQRLLDGVTYGNIRTMGTLDKLPNDVLGVIASFL